MTKCASNSIEAILASHSDIILTGHPFYRHLNYRKYTQYVKPLLDAGPRKIEMETICVFREPVSWLYSWYRFRQRFSLRNADHPDHAKSTAGISFEEFIAAYVATQRPAYANLGTQFDFVRTDSGEVGLDKIFLYEKLDELVAYLSSKTGQRFVLPRKNVSPRGKIRTRLGALIYAGSRSVSERLRLRVPAKSTPSVHAQLPPELYERLRAYIPRDFELHERLRCFYNPTHDA
jgi:hypothetical protein